MFLAASCRRFSAPSMQRMLLLPQEQLRHLSSSPGTTASAGATPTTGASPSSSTITPISRADVEAILKKLHDEQREDFDWRKSIVDLMKLLKLDSGFAARKQLAQELGYSGALDGSAEMNVWLHKQVMTKLAESGGKVPDSLKA